MRILGVIACGFFGLICVFFLVVSVVEIRSFQDSLTWVPRQAEVTESQLWNRESVVIKGKFLDTGTEFQTSRISFGKIFKSPSDVHSAFHKGKVVTVYTPENNDSDVALLKSESAIAVYVLAGIAATGLVCCAAVAIWLLKGRRQEPSP